MEEGQMSISVKADVATVVNFAAMHLKEVDVKKVSERPGDTVNVEAELVKNVEVQTDEPRTVVLHIYTVPEITYDSTNEIDLQAGINVIEVINLKYNDEFYREKELEKREGEVKIEILDREDQSKVLAFFNKQIQIQPYRH